MVMLLNNTNWGHRGSGWWARAVRREQEDREVLGKDILEWCFKSRRRAPAENDKHSLRVYYMPGTDLSTSCINSLNPFKKHFSGVLLSSSSPLYW